MQQTKTYKLNLIETSDTFSPNPLNENMEKVEAALSEVQAELDHRVTILESHKIIIGSYVGNGVDSGQIIYLGFTPQAVLVQSNIGAWMVTTDGYFGFALSIQENGFKVGNSSSSAKLNLQNVSYSYLAIL